MAVPEKFKKLANAVRDEIYGKDVREAIAKSIEETGESSETAIKITEQLIDGSFDAAELTTEIERKLNELEAEYAPELNSLKTEISDARGNESSLNDRFNSVDSQLAHVSQSLKDRAVNVKDFGAKGDASTNDSQAIIDAVNASEGYVYLPPGLYIAEGLPLRNGLHYFGAGIGPTQIALPNNPTQHMFIVSEEITGGSVKDMYLLGSHTSNIAEFNGFDFSELDRLDLFTIENCFIRRFNIGYHGTDNDRWSYITNCRIYDNKIGIKAGEHPILNGVDVRFNDIGLTGRLNDLKAVMCNFNYNRIGLEPDPTISNSLFVLCGFWGNEEKAIEVMNDNVFVACRFTGIGSEDIGVALSGTRNIINACHFNQSIGFGKGSIVVTGTAGSREQLITNNRFRLTDGPGFVASEVSSTRNINISNNIVNSINHPFLKSSPNHDLRCNINENEFTIDGDLEGSLIDVPLTYLGFKFMDNYVSVGSNASLDYVLNTSLTNALVKNNQFVIGGDQDILNIIDSNTETIIQENYGLNTRQRGSGALAAGDTSRTFNHSLIGTPTPSRIQIIPTNKNASITPHWVSDITETSFTVNIDEPINGTCQFSWIAEVYSV